MSIEDDLDAVFKALANPVRRAICDALKLRPLTTKQLCACFEELDRTTVMMHLRVLEEAGLVVPVRKGRERFNYLDAMPIQAIHERWIGPHAAAAATGLHRLKQGLEQDATEAHSR
ncbi:ArsR/SmtB family transcription factor [Pelagerythrobacter rhizovicinus]|uniref:ArsR family transcriptional regulator n=1 Tax=Pelagerythrobacter rhizovicinus TaxID=2268576 RepID=A0A4Q2KL08_9SPHN|nr:helix-turn-helix domain-containing protein [Pelagerythrobacter rhizovicinus]RXZ65994.1 ArsR family transcriptional regulator [Pelagerythrobacter rhizovicinus]